MLNNILQQQAFAQIAMIPLIAIILVISLASSIMLWRRGKTSEAISLLNTFLLIVVILLLIFSPA